MKLFLFFLMFFLNPNLAGADIINGPVGHSIKKEFNFINYDKNKIENSESLKVFYNKLENLKNTNKSKILIIHIGDSHIQADYFTGELRMLFHRYFGNAGLGIIFPYKLARTNSSSSYISFSNKKWKHDSIKNKHPEMTVGLCGISIETFAPGSEITINLKDNKDVDYSFNKVTVFYEKDERAFGYFLNEAGRFNNTPGVFVDGSGEFYDVFRFDGPLKSVKLRTQQVNKNEDHFRFYGMLFENGYYGIIYNSLGINGATFDDFNNNESSIKQLSVLSPDLLIISLGTNESLGKIINPENFNDSVNRFISKIKHYNPNLDILFTIPPDNLLTRRITDFAYKKDKSGKRVKEYYKKKVYLKNEKLGFIRNSIINYALKNNYAYWDLYSIMGGDGSIEKWHKKSLVQNDRIHFFKNGYELQGKLLFEAFLRR
ncbi:MAG: SGNH/GDSL hydrolase family protein [bacterium]